MCLLHARSFHCHLSFPQGREPTCCLLDLFYRFAKSQKMMRKRFPFGVKADDDTDSRIVFFFFWNRKPISADESTMEETIAFQRGNGNHGLQKAALACGILPSPDGLRPKLIVTKTKVCFWRKPELDRFTRHLAPLC